MSTRLASSQATSARPDGEPPQRLCADIKGVPETRKEVGRLSVRLVSKGGSL
jgi:hypothetical protein